MISYSQASIDTVTCTVAGPLTLCSHTWADPAVRRRSHALVSTAALDAIDSAADRVVDLIAALPTHLAHCPGGADRLRATGTIFGADGMWYTDAEFAEAAADGTFRTIIDAAVAAGEVFEYDAWNESLWAIDADDSAGPVSRPIRFELSARYVDLAAAAAILEGDDTVTNITFDDGRPGSYDHVPASLHVVAHFNADDWALLNDATRALHPIHDTLAHRPASANSHSIEQLLTWPHRIDMGRDILGLRATLRTTDYVEPDDL